MTHQCHAGSDRCSGAQKICTMMERKQPSGKYAVIAPNLALMNSIDCKGSRVDFSRVTLRSSILVASHISW